MGEIETLHRRWPATKGYRILPPPNYAHRLQKKWRKAPTPSPRLSADTVESQTICAWKVKRLRRAIQEMGGKPKGDHPVLQAECARLLCNPDRIRTAWSQLPLTTRRAFLRYVVNREILGDDIDLPLSLGLYIFPKADDVSEPKVRRALEAAYLLLDEEGDLLPVTELCPNPPILPLEEGHIVEADMAFPPGWSHLLEWIESGRLRFGYGVMWDKNESMLPLPDQSGRNGWQVTTWLPWLTATSLAWIRSQGESPLWIEFLIAHLLQLEVLEVGEDGQFHLEPLHLHRYLALEEGLRRYLALEMLPLIAYHLGWRYLSPQPPLVISRYCPDADLEELFGSIVEAWLKAMAAYEGGTYSRATLVAEVMEMTTVDQYTSTRACLRLPPPYASWETFFSPLFHLLAFDLMPRLGFVTLLPKDQVRVQGLQASVWYHRPPQVARQRSPAVIQMVGEQEVEIPLDAPPELFRLVGAWARPMHLRNGQLHYRLSKEQVHRSFLDGMTPHHLQKAWESTVLAPPPATLVHWWENIHARFGSVRLYRDLPVLHVLDEALVEELSAAIPELITLMEGLLTPTDMLLRSGSEDQVRALLEAHGYLFVEDT